MRGSGGGFGLGKGLGIGSILIALVGSYVFGIDPSVILSLLSGGGPVAQAPSESGQPAPQPPASDQKAQLVSRVLASTEDAWSGVFSASGGRYVPPKLVLFSGSFPTACGMGQAAAGPFYCPGDRKVYIDLRFYELMRERFKVTGDFAQAYVIAHEVGHHVQTLLGLSNRVSQMRSRMSEEQANGLSVRQELQADCYAGVWGHHAARRDFLEPGDAEEGLRAAAAIGDDRLQKQGQGYVSPESFTHGTSAQRQEWLMRGLKTGDINQCDTFGGSN